MAASTPAFSADSSERRPTQTFAGVFATRGGGSAESPESTNPVGVFEDVFVRRGRWRKNSTEESAQTNRGNVVDLAEQVATAPVDYPLPSLSEKMDQQMGFNNAIQMVVKNTFINSVGDSFQEFLSERQVQSCPAGSFDIDEIAGINDSGIDSERSSSSSASSSNEAILNTASTWQQLRTMSFDDGNFMPYSLWKDTKDPVFNTGSSFGDAELDDIQRRIAEVTCTSAQFAPEVPLMQFAAGEFCFPSPPLLPPALTASMMLVPPPPLPPAPPVLRLSEALPLPELGGPLAPSIGSLCHHMGECKPCTFFHTRGCENKEACEFCHLCRPGEKKRRLRAEKAVKRESQNAAVRNAQVILANLDAAERFAEMDFIVE